MLTVLVGWMVGRNHPDRQRTVLLRRSSTGDILAQPTGTWRTEPGHEIRTATSTWASDTPDDGLRRSATTWNIGESEFVSDAEARRESSLSPPRSMPTWMSEPGDEYVGETIRGTPSSLSRRMSTSRSERSPLLKRPTTLVPTCDR